MRIFWSMVNWLGIYAAALWLNCAANVFFGNRATAILFWVATIATFVAAFRVIVLFIKERIPAKKTSDPVRESSDDHGMQS